MNTSQEQVARLTLQSRLDFLPDATALVRDITHKMGLDERDAARLELVVEEACVNVIEHAFEGEIGSYDIVIERRPGQIVVGVEDQGLPFDFKQYQDNQESGLGMVLMKAFADEVRFLNQGRRGKRVELVKHLPEKGLGSHLEEAAAATQALNSPLPVSESDITIRLMRPEESINLARCAYRCYGYTYSTDSFYYPERMRELVAGGLMISMVAVTSSGEIMGHLSVSKETPASLVGESGQAIVDPRCRGNGIHKNMGLLQSSYCRKAGMYGTYGEAVTVHTYSQRSAFSRGYVDTGLLLGFTPATMYFKSIQGEGDAKRRPVVLLYLRLNEEPIRDVYLPPHHAGILRRIYERAKLRRNILNGSVERLAERSQVNIKVQTEASRAFMRVLEYGPDLDDLIKFRLKELCSKRIDCIYLDLPLSNPAVQRYCASMELLGFFFGGIMPELYDGDVLRLQYINNAELELKNVELASEFSKELFAYVLKASGLTPPA
jgi:anti-sigma regulatory factor (Ser/Thr protein kinase)